MGELFGEAINMYIWVHISCAAFPVRSSLSFDSTSSSRKSLVGTRVEPVVYVHSRLLQLRGDAAIPIFNPPPLFFLQALSPNSKNINVDDLYFKYKYLL